MGIGISFLVLIAGCALTLAVDAVGLGVALETVGVAVMVAGGLGLLYSTVLASATSPYGRKRVREEDAQTVPTPHKGTTRREGPVA